MVFKNTCVICRSSSSQYSTACCHYTLGSLGTERRTCCRKRLEVHLCVLGSRLLWLGCCGGCLFKIWPLFMVSPRLHWLRLRSLTHLSFSGTLHSARCLSVVHLLILRHVLCLWSALGALSITGYMFQG